jgi:hypothetical protein
MRENLCFAHLFHFCSAFISIFAKKTAVCSSRNQLSMVLKHFYTNNYANPLCSVCQGRGPYGVEIILRNANYSTAKGWNENRFRKLVFLNLFYAFLTKMSRDGTVSCLTRLWLGQPRVLDSIPSCIQIFFSSQKKTR